MRSFDSFENSEFKPEFTDEINESDSVTGSKQIGGDHYKSLVIQPADYIMKNDIPWAEGCVIKYVTRWRTKGGVQDLEKAKHFIEMLIRFAGMGIDANSREHERDLEGSS